MARTIPAPPGGVQAAYPGCRQLHPSLQFLVSAALRLTHEACGLDGQHRGQGSFAGQSGSPRCVRPCSPLQADLEWSEAQREALRPMWALYQEQVASCRALAQPHLRGLQTNTAAAAATWAAAETLPQLMGSYTGVFGNTAGLDAWLRLEAIAWADLAAGLFAVGAGVRCRGGGWGSGGGAPMARDRLMGGCGRIDWPGTHTPSVAARLGASQSLVASAHAVRCVCCAGGDPLPGYLHHCQLPAPLRRPRPNRGLGGGGRGAHRGRQHNCGRGL